MANVKGLRRLCLAAVVLALSVVVLGAYVRLTAAGLGCPDWPGCYGHLTPIGAEQSLRSDVQMSGLPLIWVRRGGKWFTAMLQVP